MASKQLFNTNHGRVAPTNTVNRAGGAAYETSAEHALCQYAVTSMFGQTYYAGGKEQLDEVKQLLPQVRPALIAKIAVYARQRGKMKDMPALLLTYLASTGHNELVKAIFPRVCNNMKMLANVIQMVRANTFGRRSLGSSLKKLFQEWFHSRNGKQLFIASIGHKNPSLADIMRLCHVRPRNNEEVALYSYLLNLPLDRMVNNRHTGYYENLPSIVKEYERFKQDPSGSVPDVPFTCLTNLNMSVEQWREKGMSLPWNTLRMNLNNLARKGLFENSQFKQYVTKTLADREQVRKHNAFPYEIMQTLKHVNHAVPPSVSNALQQALEFSLDNIPKFDHDTLIAVDTSGSMSSPVNGGGTVSCLSAAALFASALLRANPDNTTVLWFNSTDWGYSSMGRTGVGVLDLNPLDSIKTNTTKIEQAPSGGTNMSLPMDWALKNSRAKNLIFLSDNESWEGMRGGMARLWADYHRRKNRQAKLVLIDLAPHRHTQAKDSSNVLNVGGFNDSVFDVVKQFLDGNNQQEHFVKFIEENVSL